MSEQKFCIKCGSMVSDEAQFCPQCGAAIEGRDAYTRQKEQMEQMETQYKESRMMWLVFLLAMYAIPALLIGAYYMIESGPFANILVANPDFSNLMNEYGITYDDVKAYIFYAGCLVLVSGAFVLVSLICTVKRISWKIAFITCMIGSFLCIFSVFGFIIGIFVTWMIYGAKDSYNSKIA